MVENHNPDHNESKPLTTETEVLAPEATAAHTDLSPESTSTQQHETAHDESNVAAQHVAPAAAAHQSADHGTVATVTAAVDESDDDLNYDAADFAAALANFDREQAAESAAAQNLTAEEVIVTGTVVKITDKHVVVDIGLKSEGLIPLEQVLDINGVSKFQAGDTVEVVVEREESEGGYLVSYDKALRHKVWDKLEQAANDKTPVKGMVLSRVKGGLTVDIGIKAFLPGSQVEVRPVRNLDGYIGTEIEVRVIKLNKKRGNVVISRKELLEEDQNAKKSVTLATLEEGSVLTGTVKNLTDYGAFVDMGGLDGLLHITDMSWGRLTHPRDLVNVGDEIQVKVLKFDKDKQRVSLGFKQLTPDPWLDATERYPIGAQVRGRVLSVTDYGAFVELEQGIEGLVHVSEMTWSKRMKHPSKMVKPGDEVDTIILSVNPNDRRISLGMKQLQDNPWEQLEDKYPTGAIIEGRVRNLTDFGAFIEIEDGIDGLVHVSNLSWTKRIKHPSEVLKKGEKVRAIVLGVEPENRRLSLGVKQLQPDVWDTFFAQHRVGDVIKGKILRTAQFGAFVEIAEGVEGLCHVSEAIDAEGKPVAMDVDSEHEFKIVKMNQEEKKVGLSIRAVGEEASRAEVESYKEREKSPKGNNSGSSSSSSSSNSSSTTLGDLINWKRSESERD
ncbi:30S ribosomal protein S1 [Tunturibacter empetritectus]|uniref:Small ribosomal subunit protein bS1 n=1 Tax=Tunturiibacter lichenicola TaxID=2051959 RepID=A0A7W8JBV6_9BACT|nr:30S ribosomal protein S1 [Edaphobacter lichenicola]MBB5345014.1 small subunit ribosomal protein S1 [Edaphobacter lichenicola]